MKPSQFTVSFTNDEDRPRSIELSDQHAQITLLRGVMPTGAGITLTLKAIDGLALLSVSDCATGNKELFGITENGVVIELSALGV